MVPTTIDVDWLSNSRTHEPRWCKGKFSPRCRSIEDRVGAYTLDPAILVRPENAELRIDPELDYKRNIARYRFIGLLSPTPAEGCWRCVTGTTVLCSRRRGGIPTRAPRRADCPVGDRPSHSRPMARELIAARPDVILAHTTQVAVAVQHE